MYPIVILFFLTFCLIVNLSPRIAMSTGTETLTFSGGDLTTALGFIGVISTLVILVVVYRRYWNSPFIK